MIDRSLAEQLDAGELDDLPLIRVTDFLVTHAHTDGDSSVRVIVRGDVNSDGEVVEDMNFEFDLSLEQAARISALIGITRIDTMECEENPSGDDE